MSTVSSNFGVAVLARLVIGGISLIVVGLLTRLLGPVGYGQYSLVFAYLYIFSSLADMGLYTILIREISRTGANERFIVSNTFSLRLAMLAGFLLMAIILVTFLPYPATVKLGIVLGSGFSLLASLVQILVPIFQKHLKLYYVSLADVIARLSQLGLIYLVIEVRANLLTLIGVVVLAELIHFWVVFYFSRRLIKIKWAFDSDYWRQTLKKAFPVAVSLVFVLLYFKLDTVLLSLLKPSYDVGIYSVAYRVLEMLIFLPAVYLGLIMPVLSKHALANPEEFSKEFKRSFAIITVFAIPTMVYLLFHANEIIRLIGGAGFAQAGVVLKILSVAVMLIFFGNLGGNTVVALDLQKKALWIYLLGAVVNIGANWFFIPRYSYLATAWTTVITELIITILLFNLITRATKIVMPKAIIFKVLLAVGLTALLIEPWQFNLFWTSSLALLYFPILYGLKGFSWTDLRYRRVELN